MSNLSELLPAGAGAKSADFVASGTLGSGVTVALKADGTVTAVLLSPEDVGATTVFSQDNDYLSSVFDTNSNKIVLAYADAANAYNGTAIVGTVSGSSISFGTPVVFHSGGNTPYIALTFDSNSNKVVIAWTNQQNSSYGTAIVGTVSGTSISFGSSVVFQSSATTDADATFDSNSNKVVIAYRADNRGRGIVGTVSGTSISFGTLGTFSITSAADNISIGFDSNSNKVVVAYRDLGDFDGYAVVGTVSGTSISFGTRAYTASRDATLSTTTVFDSSSNKIVVAFKNASNSNYGTAVVGTVSGTSISFGAPVVFNSATTDYNSATFDSNSNKVVIAYADNGNSNYGTVIVGTVSGTSISFGAATVFESANSSNITSTFDSSANKVVIAYRDGGNSFRGTSVIFTNASSNNTDFIGITDQAIADTATGAVIVQGGVSEKASGPYFTQAGTSTAFESSNTQAINAVYDSANNKVVVAYQDFANSQYPTAVVGTISGSSISFGTPVVILSSTLNYRPAMTYDSTNQKVVVSVEQGANLVALVGTVSGTTISFGSPTTWLNDVTNYTQMVYDSANQKVVICAQYAFFVGTVSGTSISFGSLAQISPTQDIDWISAVYDAASGKILVSYMDGPNSNYGTSIVGTVSGTSISFGSAVVFNAASSSRISSAYDANAQKTLIAYQNSGNSNKGTAIVATVSGTSVSFGTPTVFSNATGTMALTSSTYDSTLKKVVIGYSNSADGYSAKAIIGTVQGTSVSFGEANNTNGANETGDIIVVYNSTENKTSALFRDISNSGYGKGVVLTATNALTIGSDYYVQADGTLSTTVSSVPAGRALSSTSILLEG